MTVYCFSNLFYKLSSDIGLQYHRPECTHSNAQNMIHYLSELEIQQKAFKSLVQSLIKPDK